MTSCRKSPETNPHPKAAPVPESSEMMTDLLLRAECILQSQIQLTQLADGGRMIPSSTLIGFGMVLEEASALLVRALEKYGD